jgi:hypothetical protein
MKRKSFRSRLFLLPLFPLYLFVYFMYNSVPEEGGKARVVSETQKAEAAEIELAIEASAEKKEAPDFHQLRALLNSVQRTFLFSEHNAVVRQSDHVEDWQENPSPRTDHSSR